MIRPADKGSGIVIMNANEYVEKVKEDLNNNDTYKLVSKDMTQTVDNKVKKLVKDLHKKGFIDDMVKQYMMPNIAEQGKVKANPKIHKTNSKTSRGS